MSPRPPIIDIREAHTADAVGVAKVHSKSWRAAYRRLLPVRYLATLTVSRLAPQWRALLPREQLALVAEHDGKVIGFATGGSARSDHPYTGELFMIYLLPGYQGFGAGRRLLAASVEGFLAQGHDDMMLWVVANNYPARGFYHAMGGRPFDERTERFAGIAVPEIAYRWTDLERTARFLTG